MKDLSNHPMLAWLIVFLFIELIFILIGVFINFIEVGLICGTFFGFIIGGVVWAGLSEDKKKELKTSEKV